MSTCNNIRLENDNVFFLGKGDDVPRKGGKKGGPGGGCGGAAMKVKREAGIWDSIWAPSPSSTTISPNTTSEASCEFTIQCTIRGFSYFC